MKNNISNLRKKRLTIPVEESLCERITFRLTPEEKTELSLKSKDRGLTLSQMCRLIVMRRKVPDWSPEFRKWIRQLTGMSNNLNQLAHLAQTTKSIDPAVGEALIHLSEETKKAKNTLINQDYEQDI